MKRLLIFLLIVFTMSICGCSIPIENYNIVLLFGIDKDVNTGGYEVTLQMPKLTSGGGEGTALSNETFTVSGVGDTVELAVKDAYIKSSKLPFLGHIQAVLIGKDMGKDGIVEMVNLFKRDPKYSLTPWMFTVDGKAKELLEAKLEYDTMPSFAILHVVNDVSKYSVKFYAVQLNKFLENIEALPHAALMGRIKLDEDGDKKMLEIYGASIYKDGKLVGMLDDQDAVGYNWLLGRFKSTDIVTDIPPQGITVNVGIERGSTDIKPIVRDNRLVYRINVKAAGYVEQSSSYPNFAGDPSLIKEINKGVGGEIAKYISNIVDKAQEQRIDYLGFEKIMEHSDPVLWDQTKDDWDDIFPNIVIEIDTEINVENTGWILNNPEISGHK